MTVFRRLVLAFVAAGVTVSASAVPAPAQPSAGATVVSLTFDDGDADQLAAAPVLARHGVAGTFYVITGAVGTPGYLTRTDLGRLASGGNEIGGHTVSHLDLTEVTPDEARRQACESRQTLAGWGFQATSFAYPHGSNNAAVAAIVRACGYDSARASDGLRAPEVCDTCAGAETTPPADPYAVRADQVTNTWTLVDLRAAVLGAAGGWVPLIFHHVCASGCGSLSITPALLDQFLTWLHQRPDVRVRTVGQVIGGPNRPPVPVPAAGPHGVVDPSLTAPGNGTTVDTVSESATTTDFPLCWMPGGYGRNTVSWSRTADEHGGHAAESVTMTGHVTGDAKLLVQFDLGECAPPVLPGHTYALDARYRSTTTTQFGVYYRTAAGRWTNWTYSPYFRPSSAWTTASWTTPPAPPGATAMSFGLALFADGTLVTDHYGLTPQPLARRPQARHDTGVLRPVNLVLAGAAVLVLGFGLLGRRLRTRARRGTRRRSG